MSAEDSGAPVNAPSSEADSPARSEADALDFSREGLHAGFVTCVPVALGVGAYGLVFGVLAREAGLSVVTTVTMSATVLAGAAQLIAVGLWDWPIPVVAVVGTTLVVNLRYLLMGASLRPWFTQLPSGYAYASLFFMADENWALTIKDLRAGTGRGAFLLGSGLAIWLFWVVATAVGAIAGGHIGSPATYGLDFVLTAIFLALLVDLWEGHESFAPWITAVLVAGVVETVLPGRWYILAGGVAASLYEVMRDAYNVSLPAILVVAGMSAVTYVTKAGGFWAVDRAEPPEWIRDGLDALPGGIIAAILTARLIHGGPVEWMAGGVVVVAAHRTGNLLLAMAAGVGALLLLRWIPVGLG